MKIIDQIPEKHLEFIEQNFLNGKTFYEIYYCETKLFQNRGNFQEAIDNWSEIISSM